MLIIYTKVCNSIKSVHTSSVSPHLTVIMIVTANTNPASGAVALPSTNTKQEETEEEEPIKCKYMRAAHGYLRWVGETSPV